jgi:hypothetical protein
MTFHPTDEPLSEPDADTQRQHPGYDGTERDVGEQACAKEIVEMGKEGIKHKDNIYLNFSFDLSVNGYIQMNSDYLQNQFLNSS